MATELNAMMEAMAEMSQVMTEWQTRANQGAPLPPGLQGGRERRKMIDMRFIKVNEFEGKQEDWDAWNKQKKENKNNKGKTGKKIVNCFFFPASQQD